MENCDQSHQDGIKQAEKDVVLSKIRAEVERIRSYTPKVAIFGDSGVGKSSLCNALFGKDAAAVSDVEACTREPKEFLLGGENGAGIILIDVPGVGEDPERHIEYKNLYRSLLPELDLVLWAIKSDDRKYSTAIEVYKEILVPSLDRCPVVFVITQADKIEPHRKWNEAANKPGDEQLANLAIKVNDISSRFDVSTNKIVAVSASDSYNLVELVNKVVEILPNEKKFSFTREANEEVVSEEAAKSAEKGVLEIVKEKAGEAWDYIKYEVADLLVDSLKKGAPIIAAKAASWVRKFFFKI